jgi:hypothetical protein
MAEDIIAMTNAVHIGGGELIVLQFTPVPPGPNGGCGTRIHVVGTNGGTMPCGALLTQFGKTAPYYCEYCEPNKPLSNVEILASNQQLRAAWADRLGVTEDDERALYGWPQERDAFIAGWFAALGKAQ